MRSTWSAILRNAIFSIMSLLFRRWVGRVHLLWPMYGVSFGVYLIDTIAWSVGTTVSFISQSKVYCSILLLS